MTYFQRNSIEFFQFISKWFILSTSRNPSKNSKIEFIRKSELKFNSRSIFGASYILNSPFQRLYHFLMDDKSRIIKIKIIMNLFFQAIRWGNVVCGYFLFNFSFENFYMKFCYHYLAEFFPTLISIIQFMFLKQHPCHEIVSTVCNSYLYNFTC